MLNDLLGALGFLTILPGHPPKNHPGRVFAYFPLVGILIGAPLALISLVPSLTTGLSAFLILTMWVALTGGLHLDGLADSLDGLLSTTTPEHRLEIMKDPRTGVWAVTGIVLILLGKWVALSQGTLPLTLILPPVIGRLATVLAAAIFPYARQTGLGGYFREGLGWSQIAIATLTTIAVTALVGWSQFVTLAIGIITALGFSYWSASRLGGGLTGDVYGAVCEVTELVCLWVVTLQNIH
jgi:adenosylcobinamide-GDP ribazoletransferase